MKDLTEQRKGDHAYFWHIPTARPKFGAVIHHSKATGPIFMVLDERGTPTLITLDNIWHKGEERDYVWYPSVAVLILDRIIPDIDEQAVILAQTDEWTTRRDFYSGWAAREEMEKDFPQFIGEGRKE